MYIVLIRVFNQVRGHAYPPTLPAGRQEGVGKLLGTRPLC